MRPNGHCAVQAQRQANGPVYTKPSGLAASLQMHPACCCRACNEEVLRGRPLLRDWPPGWHCAPSWGPKRLPRRCLATWHLCFSGRSWGKRNRRARTSWDHAIACWLNGVNSSRAPRSPSHPTRCPPEEHLRGDPRDGLVPHFNGHHVVLCRAAAPAARVSIGPEIPHGGPRAGRREHLHVGRGRARQGDGSRAAPAGASGCRPASRDQSQTPGPQQAHILDTPVTPLTGPNIPRCRSEAGGRWPASASRHHH
jgi:hypothetical protein